MTDDDKTKKAAQMLLEGASMLQISCPECHDPIYKKRNGDMVCVNCEKKIIFERDAKQENPKTAKVVSSEHPIQRKIDQLSHELENESDPSKIIELAETIKKLEALRDT